MNLRKGFLLSISVFLLDQIIKFFAAKMPLGVEHPIAFGLSWTYIQNTGMSFGLFQGNNLVLIWISIIIFGLLVYWYDSFKTTLSQVAYWLIMAGLFGNLIDRILRGFVVDMISVGTFPVFNVADSAITLAVVLLLIDELRTWGRRE